MRPHLSARFTAFARSCLALCCCLCLAAPVSPALAEEALPYALEGTCLRIKNGVQAIGTDYMDTAIDISLFQVTRLELPPSLRVIGDCGPFYGIAAKEVDFPEGLEKIGEYAFQYADLQRVSLPSTLREVSAASFGDCDHLAVLTVAEGNPWYKAVDGVLFSKDGSVLVCYPAGKPNVHYDVPSGVRAVADRAFQGNDQLESVSLPLGLQTIGKAAFADCGRLAAVSAPLTLQQLGDYAFSDCVSLERIALRETIEAGQRVFDNCPLLRGYEAWRTPEEADGEPEQLAPAARDDAVNELYYSDEAMYYRAYAILNPANAGDFVEVYASPDGPVAERFACGSTVTVRGAQGGWYQVGYRRYTDDAESAGYVRVTDAALRQTGETLFYYAGVAPRDASVRLFTNGPCVLPLSDKGRALRGDETLRQVAVEGQWCGASVCRAVVEDGFPELEVEYAYFLPSDLRFTREKTGDGKTFGVVISDDPRKRLNLRSQPDKSSDSLARYFSGTQVEILGTEGDWYRVRVDFAEGYMMSSFVEIVPEEE